jgi:uncharacterized protein (DUF2461 family)
MFLWQQEQKCTYFRCIFTAFAGGIVFLQKLEFPHNHALFPETRTIFIFHIPRSVCTVLHKLQQTPTPKTVTFGMGVFLRFFVF